MQTALSLRAAASHKGHATSCWSTEVRGEADDSSRGHVHAAEAAAPHQSSDPYPNAPPDTALYNMAKSKTLPHAPLARLLTVTSVPGVWEGTALLVTRRRRLNERVGTFSPTTTSGLQGGKRSRRLSSSSRAQT